MGLLRSEPMKHGTLVIPVDRARHFVSLVGTCTNMQFEDMNQRDMHRPYKKYIQRIDEMERILRFLTEELQRVPGAEVVAGNVDDFLLHADKYKLDEMEAMLKLTYQDFMQFKENSAQLIEKRNAALENKYVVQTAVASMVQIKAPSRNSVMRQDDFDVDSTRFLLEDEGGGSRSRALEAMFSNIAGVLPQEEQDRFSRALFRATRGNTFTHFQHIFEPMQDPKTGKPVNKAVFVIYFQDHARSASSAMNDKIQKICSVFGVNTYEWPATHKHAAELQAVLRAQVEDQERLLRAHENFVRLEAATLVELPRRGSNSLIEDWRLFCIQEKSIYATLNLFEGHMNLRANCWYPASEEDQIRAKLIQHSSRQQGHSSGMLVSDRIPPRRSPPTYCRRNEFTSCIQDIVDLYGYPRYQEANPMIFNLVTFPFLFGTQPATSIDACLCNPGYYSQFYNETMKATKSGTECIECRSLAEAPLKEERCGTDPVVSPTDMCDVPHVPVCVRKQPGINFFLVCKVYCPGGTHWPRAKAGFYNLKTVQISGSGTPVKGENKYKPEVIACQPKEACLSWNVCHFKYKGFGCGECVFGYFVDTKSKKCVACGAAQRMGMVIMAGVSVMMTVGGLFLSSVFMRVQSDTVFKQELITIIKAQIEILGKSKALLTVFRARDKKHIVELQRWDVGTSYRFAKTGDLGMVFRVDARGQIHIAGLMPDSPVRGKISPHWKLISVNGHRPHAKTDHEVGMFMKRQHFPMRFILNIPKGGMGTGKMDSFDDDRKMGVMLIGVMNAFAQVSMFEFEWPPMFTRLAALAAQLSFNFNFFKPECSVSAPFNQKWMGFIAIPYFMMIPLTTAYIITMCFTLPGWTGVTRRAKFWLLRNAYCRTVNMAVILLLPFHLEQLLVPFGCVERGEGTFFVSVTPDTLCSFEDKRYAQMLTISAAGTGMMLLFYSILILMLWRSFVWQFGRSKVRDEIPFYVGAVEMSVFGQRGYSKEARDRVMSNIAAVQTFDAHLEKFELRQRLMKATEILGPRSRWVQEAHARHGIVLDTHAVANDTMDHGEDEADSAKVRMNIMKGQDLWLKSKYPWPSHPDGNVITYGWILIINMFWRQLLSLITIKLSEGNLIVVGAAALMLIHAGNVTMLLLYKPYKSRKVSNIETIMLSSLFLVLWCAVIKDLLTNHVNVHLFQETVDKVNRGIDMLAIVIFMLVLGLPASQIYEIMARTAGAFRSSDTLLNDIHMTSVTREERIKNEQIKETRRIELEDISAEAGLKLPDPIARRLPALRRAMERINTSSNCHPTDDQRKRFRQFVSIVRDLPDVPVKRLDEGEQDGSEGKDGSLPSDEVPADEMHDLSMPGSSVEGASKRKLVQISPEAIASDSILVCTPPPDDEDQAAEIFETPESHISIGKAQKGAQLLAAGPIVDVDGHKMVPVQPEGAIELDLFTPYEGTKVASWPARISEEKQLGHSSTMESIAVDGPSDTDAHSARGSHRSGFSDLGRQSVESAGTAGAADEEEQEPEGPAWKMSPLMALAAGKSYQKKLDEGTAVVVETVSIDGSVGEAPVQEVNSLQE